MAIIIAVDHAPVAPVAPAVVGAREVLEGVRFAAVRRRPKVDEIDDDLLADNPPQTETEPNSRGPIPTQDHLRYP